MKGTILIDGYLPNSSNLFEWLEKNIEWDDRMKSRKTASFGVSYDYSEISYFNTGMPLTLFSVSKNIEKVVGFESNNCLLNYYVDGKSTMGFHSDDVSVLEEGTGVVILSLGETRILRFKHKISKEIKDFELKGGSFFYMSQEIQNEWVHSIPSSDTDGSRISLTFRKIRR